MTTTDEIAALALGVAAVSAVITAVATIAAVGSWRAARNSDRATATMSRIEQQRLHADRTPDIRCAIETNAPRSTAMLRLYLEGPPGLVSHGALAVTVSIRNDTPWRGEGDQLGNGPTPEQVRAHVWGPWRFSADGCDDTGRTVAVQQLAVGDWTQYGLTPTYEPTWSQRGADRWRSEYENALVRLTVTVQSDQGDVWPVPCEVPVTVTE